MDRPIIQDQSQGRDYDVLWGWREMLFGLGQAVLDLLGSSSTIVAGLAATPTGPASLTVNLAAGDIYQLEDIDATAYGSLAPDTNQTVQQGFVVTQSVALSTSGLSSGQSRWALIQATFTQTDVIPGDDPTGGLLAYLNANNPAGSPWSGPNNDGSTQPTRRASKCTISVIYGNPATTGSEVPPNPSANNVPLYLVDLAFGQTAITSGQILISGPSVGTGVPSNYAQAPFLAGLLNSHHSGAAGQAPKIKLGSEVQGVLPYSNMSQVRIALTANTTFYVSTTGNDTTGDGSSGNPFATVQHVLNLLATNYDLAGFAVAIQLADGTYNAGFALSHPLVGQAPTQITPLIITGNAGTPANVIINGSTTDAVTASNGAIFQIQNMKLECSAGDIMAASGAAVIFFTNIIYGAAARHVFFPNSAGQIVGIGNWTLAGNAVGNVVNSDQGGIFVGGSAISGVTVTLTGTPTFAIFGAALRASQADFTGCTFVGSGTGTRYLADRLSLVNTNGGGATFLPGNAGGSVTNGGVYA